ncbi:MAG: protein kinase domain-containing protein [Terriglobales bacterium]
MGSELEQKIGKYEVISKLGEGGMGVVYRAKDPLIDRVVAIKKMTGTFAENPEARERFLREARAVGRLQHANIVTIYEMGVEGNSPYMVMEFLEGQGLDRVISNRTPLTLMQRLDYMVQVNNALHFAHEHNIVHRDVKPANVIVLTGGQQVKLVDFGIARAGDSGMTRTGIAIGTTSYMSPEQIEASKGLDRRSDVFSSGVMFYEILTGNLPFPGNEAIAIAIKILREPYPPLSAYLENYPPELDTILEKALAKDRDERYSTAEEFAFDISQLQERLRKEMVGENYTQARDLYARFELGRARELLTEVIKAEPQHSEARNLLHEVQSLIQKQERAAQVRNFRFAAEQAVGQDRFDDALGLIDQAIRLDKADPQLQQYRELIVQGLQRKEEVHRTLDEADVAERSENLQQAQQLVEKALEMDPTDTQARMMMAGIKRRLGEVSREAELAQLAELARREISARRFTGATEVIRRIEAIDAAWDEIQKLKDAAVAEKSKEEEQQRTVEEALGKCTRLSTDGKLQDALTTLQDALKKYPEEKRVTAAMAALQVQIKQAASLPPPAQRGAAAGTMAMTAMPGRGPRRTTGAGAAVTGGKTVAAAAPARAAAAPARAPVVAPPPEKSSKTMIIAIVAAVIVIGGAVGGYFALRPQPAAAPAATSAPAARGGGGAVAAGPASLQITAVPFGMVKSVTDANGKSIDLPESDRETPLRVEVPPGSYDVVVVGPDGSEKQTKATVQGGQPKFVSVEFKQVDAKKIVDSY